MSARLQLEPARLRVRLVPAEKPDPARARELLLWLLQKARAKKGKA